MRTCSNCESEKQRRNNKQASRPRQTGPPKETVVTDNRLAVEVRDRTLEMIRPFNAPRELLYRAFSDG